MTQANRDRLIVGILLLAGSCVFVPGIDWGLPSREVDHYLFGDHDVWSGKRILALTGDRGGDPTRGADVDVDPLSSGDTPILLNETDADQAEIIRRYRLFTTQPDEMVTMMALSSMRPGAGDFDPKLYQYGGLWMYPVAAMLKVASMTGAIEVTTDLAYYYEHPERFGRFYIVARSYTVMWALVGVVAAYLLGRRLGGGVTSCGVFAALLFMCLPVVVNMSHEAKPHLPGAVLMLLAVWAAMRYVECGAARWWLITSVLCGTAFGMVLTAWPIFLVSPLMILQRPVPERQRVFLNVWGTLIGVAVYFVTNPYVAINVIVNRELLRSNLANTAQMFRFTDPVGTVLNSAGLIAEGAGPLVAVIGVIVAVAYLVRSARGRVSRTGWLLAAPAMIVALQFVAMASGQPGEHGRFAVFVDVSLAIGLAAAVQQAGACRRYALVATCVVLTGVAGASYWLAFQRETTADASRRRAAQVLSEYTSGVGRSVAVYAEPAPYVMPPVNLFDHELWLVAGGLAPAADIVVCAVDGHPGDPPEGYHRLFYSHRGRAWWTPRICWADKPFVIWSDKPLRETQD